MKLDYRIAEIQASRALDFIHKFHYSPVMPSITKHYLGFLVDGEMKAVLTLGWGTQPRQTINFLFPGLETKHYYEIGKMCIADEMPKNTGSQILSATIRLMKQRTDKLFLYTLGDGIMGKCGYVYQSANFHYGGSFRTHTYLMPNGEKLHIRSARKLLEQNLIMDWDKHNRVCLRCSSGDWWDCKNKPKQRVRFSCDFMEINNIRMIDGLMFRYIYPLNKNAKRLMKNGSTLDWNQHYPKDKDLVWTDTTDKKNKTKIDRPSFSFNETQYNYIPQSVEPTLDSRSSSHPISKEGCI